MVVRSGWVGLADDEGAAAEAEPCRGAGRGLAVLGDAARSLAPRAGPRGAGAVLGAGAGQGWDRACGVRAARGPCPPELQAASVPQGGLICL